MLVLGPLLRFVDYVVRVFLSDGWRVAHPFGVILVQRSGNLGAPFLPRLLRQGWAGVFTPP